MTENMRLARPIDPRSGLDSIPGPELVIGLVGPVGADLDLVANSIRTQLARVKYTSVDVRISSLISQVKAYSQHAAATFGSDFDRINTLMDAGSSLRRETRRADALALLTIAEIRRRRTDVNKKDHADWAEEKCAKTALTRTAYILRSLKNPAEVQVLKDVYGRAFFVVSAYSPRPTRVAGLARRICDSVSGSDHSKFRSEAEQLISKDESEGDRFGQNVRDCFPLADLFVDSSDSGKVDASISRFIEVLFGYSFHTPSRDEFSMFHAHATALRSADLSRQVGAAIATADAQILAVGCNEVPKFDGGHYWPLDANDARDYVTGHDSGTTARVNMVSEIIQRLQKAGLVADELRTLPPRDAAKQLTLGDKKHVLEGTQVLSIIEYGRAVHAEMAAITDAARRGVSVQGATLYSTAFPCHLCARHIVAAGIRRVVYIEPYPKSVAAELFEDSMVVDADSHVKDRVAFEAFVGIAPSMYSFMFKVSDVRKNTDGTATRWEATGDSAPRFRRFVPSYMLIEDIVTGSLIPATFTENYAII